MNLLKTSLCAALIGAGLAGCGSSVKLDDAAPVVDAKPNPAGGAAGAGGKGATTAQSAVTTVDASKIAANYKDGVLTIRLPRREEAKPKQIDVNVE